MAQKCGEEYSQEMFDKIVETSKKTNEELREEKEKLEELLKNSPFTKAILDVFIEEIKRKFKEE